MTPQRIQRKRTKGWRMPPNTVSVCRPSPWGNPYRVVRNAAEWWSVLDDRSTEPGAVWHAATRESAHRHAVSLYCDYILASTRAPLIRSDLRGKNLACWCPLDMPCHADVLLEVSND